MLYLSARFHLPRLERRHSEGPRFHRRDEESHCNGLFGSGDPSLRLKSGSARDEATFSDHNLEVRPRTSGI